MKAKNIILISTTIIIVSILVFAAIVIGKLSMNPKNEIDENIIKIQENCQHDWVITSKYDLMRDAFKTISKCTKCGKEI